MKFLKLPFALFLLTFVFLAFPHYSSGVFDKCYFCKEEEGEEDLGFKNCGGEGAPTSNIHPTEIRCGKGGACYHERIYNQDSKLTSSVRQCVEAESPEKDCVVRITGKSNGCITITPSNKKEVDKCTPNPNPWPSDWTAILCDCNHTNLCNDGRQKPEPIPPSKPDGNGGGNGGRGGKLSSRQGCSGMLAVLGTWIIMIMYR